MAVLHHPKTREVLACDFDFLKVPEITKKRPVVVIAISPARPGLVTVVPLSTTPPAPMQPWHHLMTRASSWDRRTRWAKCDMVYAISQDRLQLWATGGRDRQGKRIYLTHFRISEDDYKAIRAGLLESLGLGALKGHL